MVSLVRTNATLVWLLLTVLTIVSWVLGADHGFVDHRVVSSLAIFAVAVFKVRLVGLYFMELKGAPIALRGLFEGYCVLLLALLSTMYLFG